MQKEKGEGEGALYRRRRLEYGRRRRTGASSEAETRAEQGTRVTGTDWVRGIVPGIHRDLWPLKQCGGIWPSAAYSVVGIAGVPLCARGHDGGGHNQ